MKTNRRELLRGLGALGLLAPGWARGSIPSAARSYDLTIEETRIPVAGQRHRVLTINGSYPGPLVRLQEGREAVLRVHNRLREPTSVHWHGLILPPEFDGVPGVSFAGIEPGATFEARFPVRQAGTYWYHSHTGTQEQRGLVGPILIDPAEPGGPRDTAGTIDAEHVLVLTDWTPMNPDHVMALLKKQSHFFNFQRRTVIDALTGRDGMTMGQTLMWGRMRMDPTDIADVTGATYHYLLNGRDALENWTATFDPGQRVRLRIINASAMTTFDVRIPGLPMHVVEADGQPVLPVEVDELRIAVAETYDVVVQPREDAYTIFAETMDRSGFARGTLAVREGLEAPIPERRRRPLLTMDDMGMSMKSMGSMKSMQSHDMEGMEGMQGMDHGDGMAMSRVKGMKEHAERSAAKGIEPADLASLPPLIDHDSDHHGPGNIMIAEKPRRRVAERGNGLEDAPWRVLVYADLESPVDQPDPRPPSREISIHLTGHMERYIWSFNGEKFSDAPFIELAYDERVRITYVNDTMMAHPIHLHGMFVELENGRGRRAPRKHTVQVAPGEQLSVLLTADEAGDWAYHCHLLYHMDFGMFRVVRVADPVVASVSP